MEMSFLKSFIIIGNTNARLGQCIDLQQIGKFSKFRLVSESWFQDAKENLVSYGKQ